MEKSTIVATPGHYCDPSIAIAAARAGAIGLLDLGYDAVWEDRTAALAKLAGVAGEGRRWGARWDTWGLPERMPGDALSAIDGQLPILLVAGVSSGDNGLLRSVLAQSREYSKFTLLEVTGVEPAVRAAEVGFDGLVVKGNESGGRVSVDSSFLLLQQLRGRVEIPWWIQGAWGPDTAAAAELCGAAGLVLNEELWLARESPLSTGERAKFARLDGSESECFGDEQNPVRLFNRVDRETLQSFHAGTPGVENWPGVLHERWRVCPPGRGGPLVAGQGIAFAGSLARRHGSVGRILQAFRRASGSHISTASSQRAMSPDGPLAKAIGINYPIIQGPMTRVSDSADFARKVAENGALPFLALALMRGREVRELLEDTRRGMGDLRWGVGILGFVPRELHAEQLEVIREFQPPFAIIAGGQPGQIAKMEREGIATYVHVPSPGLLEAFLAEGARRFIFEGRECGGHVGPRSSLVLWQSAIDVLMKAERVDEVEVLFAGGIHDAYSTAMVAVLAAPLVDRGVKIGVLLGTAYLFTEEIVASGALSEVYQVEALKCAGTTLLKSGVGHASRCAQTEFATEFDKRREALQRGDRSAAEIRLDLELLNVGRLRLASKGLVRSAPNGGGHPRGALNVVDAPSQRRDGMFMMGQLACLRNRPVKMADLHEAVSVRSGELLEQFARSAQGEFAGSAQGVPPFAVKGGAEPIAIIGMAGIFPDAPDLRTFWENIVSEFDSVREVPARRWRKESYYDPDRRARDRFYTHHGSFLGALRFDPTRFGMPPATLRSIEPLQCFALEVVLRALEDAGLSDRPFARERTGVVFGASGVHDQGIAYAFRTMLEHYMGRVDCGDAAAREAMMAGLRAILPEWTEDSLPGFLPNVIAGRISNRLDLRGVNYTVDAACASSLASIHAAVLLLRTGSCEMVVAGGADCSNNATTFMGFAKAQALTPGGIPRPFDAEADGMVLGECVGAVVLKRLSDAERDGDEIHALIRGMGCSSDGRNRSLTAPHAEGQVNAIRRAFDEAGIDPATVSLVEAHATGTALGDDTEIKSLDKAFGPGDRECGIGSIKSQIGHAKAAAGIAGVIKTALALRHGILPPTINVRTPIPRLQKKRCRFYVNAKTRPWVPQGVDQPRRAGVSAFGFGGTNFHAVMESYEPISNEAGAIDLSPRPAEIFTWRRRDRRTLRNDLERFHSAVEVGSDLRVDMLAMALANDENDRLEDDLPDGAVRLGLVAESVADLLAKTGRAMAALREGENVFDPLGCYLSDASPANPCSVAFLFPGQGSQRINMLADLVCSPAFGSDLFAEADNLLAEYLPDRLSRYLFPPPSFEKEGRRRQEKALEDTRVAQPAIGVIDLFALDVLLAIGLRPAFCAGHSYGEYVALCAAGVYTREDLLLVSVKRGKAVHEVAANGSGGMIAVAADRATVEQVLNDLGLPLHIANLNAPKQTIVGGPIAAVEAALAGFSDRRVSARRVQVGAAFHTPAVEKASRTLIGDIECIEMRAPEIPVFSNVTAAPYPNDAAGIKDLLNEHLAHPVRFVEEISAMHDAGARIFIEAGPGRILTGLVKRILEDKEHTTIPLERAGEPTWVSLGHLAAHTFALGLPVSTDAWFKGRRLSTSGVKGYLQEVQAAMKPGPVDWWVDPAGSRPADGEPEVDASAEINDRRAAMDSPDRESPSSAEPPDFILRQQELTQQWIELQREQLKLNERFLAQQERLMAAHFGGSTGPGSDAQGPRYATPAPPAISPGPLAVSPAPLAVAPAPVLPSLVTGKPLDRNRKGAGSPKKIGGLQEPAGASIPSVDRAYPSDNGGPAPSVEDFRADLIAEVTRRTGYPESMLDPELPLEAGLGIDSIKVMEIFSALKPYHRYLADREDSDEAILEQFTELKTLNEIIRHYAEKRSAAGSAALGMESVQAGVGNGRGSVSSNGHGPVERLVVRSVASAIIEDVDVTANPMGIPTNYGLLVLGDAPGLGVSVRAALRGAGYHTWQVIPGESEACKITSGSDYSVDLRSRQSVEAFARILREEESPAVGGIVNLLNLGLDFREPTRECSDAALGVAQSLLCVAQVFEREIRNSVENGGGLVVNLTALDGRFGLSGSRPLPLAQAASLGFMKSLAQEWRGVRVKTVDVDPEADPEVLLMVLARELASSNGSIEVGVGQNQRWMIDPAVVLNGNGSTSSNGGNGETDHRAVASENFAGEFPIEKDSVVLVTGGARGIAAEALKSLVGSVQTRLVIVGRSSAFGEEDEPPVVRGLDDVNLVRKALIEMDGNGGLGSAEIEGQVERVVKARAIRANLEHFERAGSSVEYHAFDVRDEVRLTELVASVYDRYGRIDAVIHAAGIIEDHLIRGKDPESFARVFATKVEPAFTLARVLRPESLRFFGMFSSVSARFGNAGQTDYGSANEVLNKLAGHLDREWPGRVVSINWGAWDSGMVSEGLKAAYRSRGIRLISPDAGGKAFLEEMRRGKEPAPEVILACDVDAIARAGSGESRV